MLNKSFEIGLQDNDSNVLLLEVGETYCVLSFLNTTRNSLDALQVYTFESAAVEESIREMLNSVIEATTLDKVVFSSAFPEALLIPRKFYSSNSFVNALYPTPNSRGMHDVVSDWQLVTSYTIPDSIFQIIRSRFSNVEFIHAYTSFLKENNGITADHQLRVHFVGNQFRVLLKKHQQVYLVQTYSFASPMDVVYYLLKILTEFGISQEDVHLVLSGFIDEKSALYKDLYSFFLNIDFVSATTLILSQQDHPNHFFTSTHNLAACVL